MILRLPRFLLLIVSLGLPGLLAQTPPPPAPANDKEEAYNPNEPVNLILTQGSIDDIIPMIQMISKRAVLRPAALPVSGNIPIIAPRTVPASEAIQIIQTVLGMNGIGLVPMGEKYFKMVPLVQTRTEAPEMIPGSTLELMPSGRIAAKLFQPEYLRIEDLTAQVQNLVSPAVGGAIVPFPKANAALITDSISNLQRIETLIQRLDRAAPLPKFYTLKFAKASDLSQRIQGILQNQSLQAQLGATPTYTADDRTNQIIIVCDEQQRGFFDELVQRLDIKADPNTRTDVIYLKHGDSADVASLLTSVISGQNNAAQRVGGQQQIQRVVETVQAPATPAGQPAAPRTTTRTGETAPSTTFSSIITVIADKRTNSIVVNGTLDDIRLIRELVDKIDIVLPQVRIEVVIAEVTLSDNQASGIDALGLQVDANRLIGISGSTAGASLGGSMGTDGKTTSFATINRPGGGGYTLSGIIGLNTSPRKTNANILNVPTITTTHNKKAEFKVTTDYPTISSYLNDTSSAAATQNIGAGYRSTVGRTSAGTTLTVTPLIGDDGSVQLDISQEVSDVMGNTSIDGNTQPIIGTRKTTSFITAKSGEIIVLGGMQRSNDNANTNRLGPVPFIGDLLGTRTKKKERTDLIFFLRPVVLTNTAADNAEFMQRLEANPSKDAVKRALDPKLNAPREETKQPSVRKK
jgi:general secretion pathway protein D